MNRSWPRVLGLVAFGALLSQAGHLLVYQIQFGAAAQSMQSTGAHSYFPTFAKTGLGIGAAGLVVGLFLIGVARVVTGGATARIGQSPSYINLLALLFTIQLAFFGIQETIESLAAGTAAASAPQLILWGTVGQLPIAALGALALKWLLVRFEEALLTLRAEAPSWRAAGATPVLILLPRSLCPEPALAEACPSVYAKRGPPPGLPSRLL